MIQDRPSAGARLRPYFVCRLSGAPVGRVECLRSETLLEADRELRRLEQDFDVLRHSVLQALFDAVSSCEEATPRRRLLKIKRAVFNSRSVDHDHDIWLPDAASAAVTSYSEALGKLRQAETGFRDLYGAETFAARTRLRASLDDADFQKGLELSSPSLAAALRKYLVSADEAYSGRSNKVERGLLRYLTRMSMKATPFGTFSAVVPGTFGARHGPVFELAGDPLRKLTSVRLNKSIYGLLLSFLKSHPAIRRRLRVQLNPTLQEEDGRFVFLTDRRGLEIFQRVGATPVLQLAKELLETSPEMRLGELMSRLLGASSLDATEEEVVAFIGKLLDIGFLSLSTGIREQDPDWDYPLRAILQEVDDDAARSMEHFLARLRHLADEFSAGGAAARNSTLDEIRHLLDSELERLGLGGRLRKPLPIYEDATSPAALTVSLPTDSSEWLRDLVDFVSVTLPLAAPRQEQAEMRHFYDSYYGPGVEAVPLLSFYEDFYREHYKEYIRRDREYRSRARRQSTETDGYDVLNPFGLSFVAELRAARWKVSVLIARRWAEAPDADEIVLQKEDLEQISAQFRGPEHGCRSVSLFAQLLPCATDRPRLIVPNGLYLLGFGKYFSRFLYLLPPEVGSATLADNQALTDDLLAEICGDAQFNANLHPPLLPWEITYPTGETGPSDQQIFGWDLEVRRAPEDEHALQLQQRSTGRRVVPVDLGFLNLQRRPPLYQLLTRFGPPMFFDVPVPSMPRSDRNDGGRDPSGGSASEGAGSTASGNRQPAVLRRPRIRFGESLVIARECWIIPSDVLPVPRPQEPSADYFRRVHRWREEQGIPLEAFARVWPDTAPPRAAPDGASVGKRPVTAGSRDYRKPQYIDFANPLLVDLFSRLVTGIERSTVVLEERLPDRHELPVWHGDRYAYELILQLDVPESPRSGEAAETEVPGFAHV